MGNRWSLGACFVVMEDIWGPSRTDSCLGTPKPTRRLPSSSEKTCRRLKTERQPTSRSKVGILAQLRSVPRFRSNPLFLSIFRPVMLLFFTVVRIVERWVAFFDAPPCSAIKSNEPMKCFQCDFYCCLPPVLLMIQTIPWRIEYEIVSTKDSWPYVLYPTNETIVKGIISKNKGLLNCCFVARGPAKYSTILGPKSCNTALR